MTGEKRQRKPPSRFIPWKEGDKHAPMAHRKKQDKVKKEKVKQKEYQQVYRATITKEKKKLYNKTFKEKKKGKENKSKK